MFHIQDVPQGVSQGLDTETVDSGHGTESASRAESSVIDSGDAGTESTRREGLCGGAGSESTLEKESSVIDSGGIGTESSLGEEPSVIDSTMMGTESALGEEPSVTAADVSFNVDGPLESIPRLDRNIL